jgi:acetamidase/formamidase
MRMLREAAMADHTLTPSPETVHRDWDRSRDPVLTIEPGDTVEFDCLDATDGQLRPDATPADVRAMEFGGHPLTGPVAVAGAEPGDTLRIDINSVEHHGVGYTYCYAGDAGKGLLPADFPEPAVHVWDLDSVGHFVEGIEVPLAPFPGCVGVAPAEAGPLTTVPPRRVGGNLDVKHLTAGSTLYLPVEVAGALFSVGDGHAAQGDGEVCVTAIETGMTVEVRLSLAERSVDGPEFETTGPYDPAGGSAAFATMGVAPDLLTATEEAMRALIERVHRERGLTHEEAYLLCSVAADLKVSAVVNQPNYAVSAYLSESLFP